MTEIVKVFNINIAKGLNKRYNYLNEFEKNMAMVCRIFTATKLSDLKKETDCFMTKEESKNFVNRARELSSDDEMVTMFDQENMREIIRNTELLEAHESGISTGVEQGKEQGSNEKAIDRAKKYIAKKMDTKIISELTGLSTKTIEKLISKHE